MDYPLEELGPEGFQQFCQSLLVKEFPKLQCFPIAQPDGGRDGLTYLQESGDAKETAFRNLRGNHSLKKTRIKA